MDENDQLLYPLSDDELRSARDTLRRYLDELHIDISDEALAHEITYLRLLLEKTKHINLTAVKDFSKGIALHLVDSLLYLKAMYKYGLLMYDEDSDDEFIRLLDMGTGGGMPGIPLAIASDDVVGVLDDSTKKKIAAVDEFIAELSLGDRVTTSTKRIEELPFDYPDGFSVVVTRALGSLPTLLEYASPLLVEDGILIISKGTPSWEELRSAQRVERMVGMGEIATEEYELPDGYGHRTILVYGKMEPSRVDLPRAIGMAKNQPLA